MVCGIKCACAILLVLSCLCVCAREASQWRLGVSGSRDGEVEAFKATSQGEEATEERRRLDSEPRDDHVDLLQDENEAIDDLGRRNLDMSEHHEPARRLLTENADRSLVDEYDDEEADFLDEVGQTARSATLFDEDDEDEDEEDDDDLLVDYARSRKKDPEVKFADDLVDEVLKKNGMRDGGYAESVCYHGSRLAIAGTDPNMCAFTPFFDSWLCGRRWKRHAAVRICRRLGGHICDLSAAEGGDTQDSTPEGCGADKKYIFTRTFCRKGKNTFWAVRGDGTKRLCQPHRKKSRLRCCYTLPPEQNLTFSVGFSGTFDVDSFVNQIETSFYKLAPNATLNSTILSSPSSGTSIISSSHETVVFRLTFRGATVTGEEFMSQVNTDAPAGWDLSTLVPNICARTSDICEVDQTCSDASFLSGCSFGVCKCDSGFGFGEGTCASSTSMEVPIYKNVEASPALTVKYQPTSTSFGSNEFTLNVQFQDYALNCGTSCANDIACEVAKAAFGTSDEGQLDVVVPSFQAPIVVEDVTGTLDQDQGATLTKLFESFEERPGSATESVSLTFSNGFGINVDGEYIVECEDSSRTLRTTVGTVQSKPGAVVASKTLSDLYLASFHVPSASFDPSATCKDMFANISKRVTIEGEAEPINKVVYAELETFGVPQVSYEDTNGYGGTMDLVTDIVSNDEYDLFLGFTSYTKEGTPFEISITDTNDSVFDPLACTAEYGVYGSGKVSGANLYDGRYLSRDGLLKVSQGPTNTVCELTIPTGVVHEAGSSDTTITFDVDLDSDSADPDGRRRLLPLESLMEKPRLLGQKRKKKTKAKGGHKAKGNPSPKFRRMLNSIQTGETFAKPHVSVTFDNDSNVTEVNIPVTTNTDSVNVEVTIETDVDGDATVNETIQCVSGYTVTGSGDPDTGDVYVMDGSLNVTQDDSTGDTESSLGIPTSEVFGSTRNSGGPLRIVASQSLSIVDNLVQTSTTGSTITTSSSASYNVAGVSDETWENSTEGHLISSQTRSDGTAYVTLGYHGGATDMDLDVDIDREVFDTERRLLSTDPHGRLLGSSKKKKKVKSKGGHKSTGNASPKFRRRRILDSLDDSPYFGTIRLQESENDDVSVVLRVPLDDVVSPIEGGDRRLSVQYPDFIDIVVETSLDVDIDEVESTSSNRRLLINARDIDGSPRLLDGESKKKKVKAKGGHKSTGTPSPKFRRRRLFTNNRFLAASDTSADHLRVHVSGSDKRVTVSNDIWGGTNQSNLEYTVDQYSCDKCKSNYNAQVSSQGKYNVSSESFTTPGNENEPDGQFSVGDTSSGGFNTNTKIPSSDLQASDPTDDNVEVTTSTDMSFSTSNKDGGSFSASTSYKASGAGLGAAATRRRRLSEMGASTTTSEDVDSSLELNFDSSYNLNLDTGADGNQVSVDATVGGNKLSITADYNFGGTGRRRRRRLVGIMDRYLTEISAVAGGALSLSSSDGSALSTQLTLPESASSLSSIFAGDEPVTANIEIKICDSSEEACENGNSKIVSVNADTTLDGGSARRRLERLQFLEKNPDAHDHHRRILKARNVFATGESRQVGTTINETTATFNIPVASNPSTTFKGTVGSQDGSNDEISIVVTGQGDGSPGTLDVTHGLGGGSDTTITLPLPDQTDGLGVFSSGFSNYDVQSETNYTASGDDQTITKKGSTNIYRKTTTEEEDSTTFDVRIGGDGSILVDIPLSGSDEDTTVNLTSLLLLNDVVSDKFEFSSQILVSGGSTNGTKRTKSIVGLQSDGEYQIEIPLRKGSKVDLTFRLVDKDGNEEVDTLELDSKFGGVEQDISIDIRKPKGGSLSYDKKIQPTSAPTTRPTNSPVSFSPTTAPTALVGERTCANDCGSCATRGACVEQGAFGRCIFDETSQICFDRLTYCMTKDCRVCLTEDECVRSDGYDGYGCTPVMQGDYIEDYYYYSDFLYNTYYYYSGERRETSIAEGFICKNNVRPDVDNKDYRNNLCNDYSTGGFVELCENVTENNLCEAAVPLDVCTASRFELSPLPGPGDSPFCSLQAFYACPRECQNQCGVGTHVCFDSSPAYCLDAIARKGCDNYDDNGVHIGQMCPGSCPSYCNTCEDRDATCYELLFDQKYQLGFPNDAGVDRNLTLMGFEGVGTNSDFLANGCDSFTLLPMNLRVSEVCPYTCGSKQGRVCENNQPSLNERFKGPCVAVNSPSLSSNGVAGSCVFPFRLPDGTMAHDCVHYSKLNPFNPDQSIHPPYGRVCAMVENYNPTDTRVNQQWGYCSCPQRGTDGGSTDKQVLPNAQYCPTESFTVLLYSQLRVNKVVSHSDLPAFGGFSYNPETRVGRVKDISDGQVSEIVRDAITFVPFPEEGACVYKINKYLHPSDVEGTNVTLPVEYYYTRSDTSKYSPLAAQPTEVPSLVSTMWLTTGTSSTQPPLWRISKPASYYKGKLPEWIGEQSYIGLEHLATSVSNFEPNFYLTTSEDDFSDLLAFNVSTIDALLFSEPTSGPLGFDKKIPGLTFIPYNPGMNIFDAMHPLMGSENWPAAVCSQAALKAKNYCACGAVTCGPYKMIKAIDFSNQGLEIKVGKIFLYLEVLSFLGMTSLDLTAVLLDPDNRSGCIPLYSCYDATECFLDTEDELCPAHIAPTGSPTTFTPTVPSFPPNFEPITFPG